MFNKPLIFIVVGVGGIGGAVCRDLPKLITGTNSKIMLVDGDIVENKNCVRQPFQQQDIGHNKARALARKINSFYNIECYFTDSYITDKELDAIVEKHNSCIPVYLGCVDNDATRQLIELSYITKENAIYIDGANSEYEGNVYVSYIENGIRKGKIRSDVYELSNDTNPGLVGCEERISQGETQFLITNNRVAASMLEHIFPFIINSENKYEGVTVIERFKEIHY